MQINLSDVNKLRPVNIICIPTKKLSHNQGIQTRPRYLMNSELFLIFLGMIMELWLWLQSLSFSCPSRNLYSGAGFGIIGGGRASGWPQMKDESVAVETD